MESGRKFLINLGVVGAGQMGTGIAFVAAIAGHNVKLYDSDENALMAATRKFEALLEKSSRKNETSNEASQSAKEHFQIVDTLESLGESEFIIEAIKEDYAVKESLFERLKTVAPKAIIATNTSSLSIKRLSRSANDAKLFLGTHFMNPVRVMPLVEIITHDALAESTLNFTIDFCSSLSKKIVKCRDTPGFVVNRLLLPMINQAIELFSRGTAGKEDIDAAMRLGANFPMGPLELADFIGLDTCLFILRTLFNEEKDGTVAPPSALLVTMVDEGKLGKKSGQGFYDYEQKTRPTENPMA